MLFLSCNNTHLSKDMASLGFTSVSSPWEAVYHFLPRISLEQQASPRDPPRGAGLLASAKIPPWCPAWLQGWWWQDDALGNVVDGNDEALAVGLVPMWQRNVRGMWDTAEQPSPQQREFSIQLTSPLEGVKKTVSPFSGVRCVQAYIWMLHLLLNLVSLH